MLRIAPMRGTIGNTVAIVGVIFLIFAILGTPPPHTAHRGLIIATLRGIQLFSGLVVDEFYEFRIIKSIRFKE